MVSLHCFTGFFNSVQYEPALKDDSWCGKIEAFADVCRAPSRWLATELWVEGNHVIGLNRRGELSYHSQKNTFTKGIRKIVRIVLGILLYLPGQIVGAALMGIAYICSEEIRLKHRFSVKRLSLEEHKRLKELIKQRQDLAKERQGCEPISCLLCSICCLLCVIACKIK